MESISKNPDLSKHFTKISKITETINYPSNVKVFLVKSRKRNYIYKLEVGDPSKKIIIEELISELEKKSFTTRDITQYDLTLTPKDCHLLFDMSEYPNTIDIANELDNDAKANQNITKDELKKIDYYVISIEAPYGKNYKIIGRFNNITKVQSKSIFGELQGNILKIRKSSDVAGLNKKPEVIILNNEKVLINSAEAVFDSVFNMKDFIVSQASSNLSSDQNLPKIFTPEIIDRIKDKISNNKRLSGIMLKILKDSERLKHTIENMHNINSVLGDPAHKLRPKIEDITYDANTKQITAPEGKEDQLITVISDAMYTAIISGTDNLDESRYHV